ncbi:MAG: aminotransferase class IV, partial [Acidobacteria bacterium]|nr:aminotransferase class IV [Acidobacteriota bacterium]MDW7984118.1 aminotransferase class IV [Acidobacteriota bacterium]
EGIALDVHGFVSEGSGENLFLVYKGALYTPTLASSILFGITRDSVITLARDLNIPVVETWIPREMLYIADEVFLTGTAAEITPVRSIDDIVIGRGEPGEVTRRLQDAFFGLIQGRWPDRYQWLTYV